MTGVNRPNITQEYVKNQVTYLSTLYPQINIDQIWQFVRDIVNSKSVIPTASIIKHRQFNSELVDVDLLSLISTHNNKTITPSGSWYETSDVKKAPDVEFMLSRLKMRSVHKKKMLEFKSRGQFQFAMLEDFRQGSVKIGTNSVIGASGNEHSILFDLENFNGITSLSRHGIMAAYVFVERFLTNNMYFKSIEQVINYIVTSVRVSQQLTPQIENVINKYKLHIPTTDEVYNSFRTNMSEYFFVTDDISNKLHTLVYSLSDVDRVFVSYHLNMWYLMNKNETSFKTWIDDLFDTTLITTDHSLTPSSIESHFDEDLSQLVSVTCANLINGRVIKDLHMECWEDAKRIISIGKYMERKFSEISEMFELFMYAKLTIPSIDDQKDLTRRAVILSDTDSVVFTTDNWVQWYDNSHNKTKTLQMSSLCVYWLSKSIARFISYISYHRGAIGEFTDMIKIKNEFLFPILVRSELAKHYFAIKTIQEGKTLPVPQLEIKGLQYKTSTLPDITNNFTKDMIESVLHELNDTRSLDIKKYINDTLNYEKVVYDSLKNGELLYVSYLSLKHSEEYASPEKSVYRNYLIWQALFSSTYGDIRLPTKVPVIPLLPKILISEKYLNWLSGVNKQVYKALIDYPEEIRKKLTRMPLNNTVTTIPKELMPCIDIRSIVYKNTTPAQLVLRSFRVTLNNDGKRKLLFSDIYPSSLTDLY